jgi:hypothetical protein
VRHGDKEFCRRRTRGDKAAAGKLVNTLRGDKTVAGKLVNTSVNTSAAPREAKVVDDVPPSLGDGKDMGKLRIEDGMNVCSCSLSCVGPRLHYRLLTLCPAPTDPVGQSWPLGTGSVGRALQVGLPVIRSADVGEGYLPYVVEGYLPYVVAGYLPYVVADAPMNPCAFLAFTCVCVCRDVYIQDTPCSVRACMCTCT